MGLNKEQAEAVNHIYGPMLVLAGPGSGKTFTLVERVRHLIEDEGIPPEKILVITFSKKAALEMQVRFKRLIQDKFYPVSFGTFHAIFYHILKEHNSYSNDSVLTQKTKIEYLITVGEELNISKSQNETWLNEILSKISLYKSLEGSENEKIGQLNLKIEDQQEFLQVYELYQERVRAEGKIDFDDMIWDCYKLLTENEVILKKWQGLYKYFLVDEFQDINDIQYKILMLLAGKDKNIFAVGDDDQSIYAFRGSKPAIMKSFARENEAKIVNLCKNYRCPEIVINKSVRFIENNKDRIKKSQFSAKKDKDEGSVIVEHFENASLEADYICNQIKKNMLIQDKSYTTVVLSRTLHCVNLLEERFIAAGIVYERNTERKEYYKTEWIEDIITYLKLSKGEKERSLYYRILNRPDRKLSREALYENVLCKENCGEYYKRSKLQQKIWNKLEEDIKFISKLTPYAAVNYILKGMGYEEYLKRKEINKGLSLTAVEDDIAELLSRSKDFPNISSWLEYIDLIDEKIKDDKKAVITGNKVIMMTAHASKGLEFDNVFIAGLQEGLFPHNKALSEEDIEEERRLMYVAMTRSRRNLYICGRGDNEHGKRESRFLYEIARD